MRPTRAVVFGLVVALLGLGAVTRLPSLDADPPLLKSVDELSDEGYWCHNARAAALFGTPFPDDLAQGPAAAPLFHWTLRAVFQTLGVSYTSLRLPSALAGMLLAPVVFLLALPSLGLRAAVVAGALTLANHELFAFGRLGLPEALHVLLCVAGAAAWIHRRSRLGALAAGVLFGLSLLAKLNVLVLVGFAGVWLLERLRGQALRRDLLVFAAGLAAVLAPWLVLYYLPHAALFGLNTLALNRDRVALQVSDLGRLPLHFMANPFWGLPSTWLLLALAGLHMLTHARAHDGWHAALKALSPVEVLALGWLLGVGVPTALVVRAVGERRVLVVLIPLALLAAAACARRAEAPPSARGRAALRLAGVAVAVWTLDILALLFTNGYGQRLQSLGGVGLVCGAIAAAWLAARLAAHGVVNRRLATVAIVAGMATLPSLALGRFVAGLSHADASAGLVIAIGVGVAGVGALAVAATRPIRVVAPALVALSITWGGLALGSTLAQPTFTLRDAARRIDTLVPAGVAVSGAFAHELSLENRTLPIWYTPRRPYNQLLNADLRRFAVGYVFLREPPSSFTVLPGDLDVALEPVARFALYPTPHGLRISRDAVKAVIVLYRARRAAAQTSSTRRATASQPWPDATHARPAAPS